MNDYVLLFSAGLLGALHCVGMCGGLIAACGLKFSGGMKFSVTYNAGRLFSYSILGFFMGFLGKVLIATGLFGKFQGVLPAVAGILMVLIGLDLLGYIPESLKRTSSGLFPKALSGMLIGGQLKKRRPAPFILGMLNGLLPCGLLYAIGVKAVATASPLEGMLTMAAFGTGTLPAMLLIGSFSGVFGTARSRILPNLASVFIILLGCKTIFYSIGRPVAKILYCE